MVYLDILAYDKKYSSCRCVSSSGFFINTFTFFISSKIHKQSYYYYYIRLKIKKNVTYKKK